MKNKNIGTKFDVLLNDQSLLTQAQAVAVSRVFAWELEYYIAKENVSKTTIARSLDIGRRAIGRVINTNNANINL